MYVYMLYIHLNFLFLFLFVLVTKYSEFLTYCMVELLYYVGLLIRLRIVIKNKNKTIGACLNHHYTAVSTGHCKTYIV